MFLSDQIIKWFITFSKIFKVLDNTDIFLEFLGDGLGIVGFEESLLEFVFSLFVFDCLFATFIELGFYGVLGVVEKGLEETFENELGSLVDHAQELLVEVYFVGFLHGDDIILCYGDGVMKLF